MTITWKRCHTYNEAKDYTGVIYLHERNGKPFYWGIAHTSSFGTRYNSGYKHWVDASLEDGDLFIGQLDNEALERIKDIELFLINTHPSKMNVKEVGRPHEKFEIEHLGDAPSCLTN